MLNASTWHCARQRMGVATTQRYGHGCHQEQLDGYSQKKTVCGMVNKAMLCSFEVNAHLNESIGHATHASWIRSLTSKLTLCHPAVEQCIFSYFHGNAFCMHASAFCECAAFTWRPCGVTCEPLDALEDILSVTSIVFPPHHLQSGHPPTSGRDGLSCFHESAPIQNVCKNDVGEWPVHSDEGHAGCIVHIQV